MYNVLVVIYKLNNNKEEERIKKLLDIIQEEYKLIQLTLHKIENHIKSNTIIITFGPIAYNKVIQYIEDKKIANTKIIQLPILKQLEPIEKNRKYREEAYKALQECQLLLKENGLFPEQIIIREEDLPDLDNRQILMLQKITEDNNRNRCFQTTKNNKLIEISNIQLENSRADIQITFNDLFVIKTIMNTLDVKEVHIERIKKNDD